MALYIEKQRIYNLGFKKKSISNVYYKKKQVYPDNVDETDYFWIDNMGSCSEFTVQIPNMETLNINLEYSENKISWTTFSGKKSFNGGKSKYIRVYFRGVSNSTYSSDDTEANFVFSQTIDGDTTATLKVGGDILTLLDKSQKNTVRPPSCCFKGLFSNCSLLVDASELILSPNYSNYRLYMGMFYNCTDLITSPMTINLTDMYEDCCRIMFYKCSKLVNIPDTWCPNVKELVYRTSFGIGYKTTYAIWCFSSCFRETAIKKLPNLPATTLSSYCYAYMFAGCNGLTTQTGWYLPATTFSTNTTSDCYSYMFSYCNNITKVATKQTNISVDYNYNWLYQSNSKGTIYMPKSSTQSSYSTKVKPTGWTISKSL